MNDWGQAGLALGTTITSMGSLPTHMSNLAFVSFTATMNALGVADVSVGNDHTCVMFATGSITCFGRNVSGQLGLTLATNVAVGDSADELLTLALPVVFKYTTVRAVQIAAGVSATCALFTNGGILCWGRGDTGLIGRDTAASVGSAGLPVNALDYISFFDTIPAKSISLKYDHACAVFVNNRARCWGSNSNSQLGELTGAATMGTGAGANSITSAAYVVFPPTINTIPLLSVAAGR